ncbi:MAG: histidinol-phosphatase [Treponemataceae bacterium]
MKLSCLHTHTDFCDGVDSVEVMCQAAFDAGLSAIGFSAHAPMPFRTGWHLTYDRLDEYTRTVRAAEAQWKGRLAVYLGLEIDYIAGTGGLADGKAVGPADGRFSRVKLDYTIGSVHYLRPANGTEPFTVDGPYDEWERGVREGYGGDGEAAAEAYWEAVTEMIRARGFDFVGHLDLVKKNNGAGGRPPSFDPSGNRYRNAAKKAIEAIRESGVVVEINTGAMNRGSLKETYPSHELLEELRKVGARIIINADAHRADHITGHYEKARQALRAAGFTETVLFEGKNWVTEPIE